MTKQPGFSDTDFSAAESNRPRHEQLLEKAQALIQDFTCPIYGMPTPDRQASLGSYDGGYVYCKRSIWGVSAEGNAIRITQGYSLPRVRHMELRVDLFENGQSRPVAINQAYAIPNHKTDQPLYKDFIVNALQPHPDHSFTLIDADVPSTAEKIWDTLNNQFFAWLTPVDVTTLSHFDGKATADNLPTSPQLMVWQNDPRIMLAPYDFPDDPVLKHLITFDSNAHTPSVPATYLSMSHVSDMEASIRTNAADLCREMASRGALDISKI